MKSRDFKNPNFPTLVSWEKFGNTTLAHIHKTQFFIFFMNCKNVEVQLDQHSKIQNFLVNWENLGSAAIDQHSKISILILWINKEKFYLNLSFTVENKIGNLHKMRLQ